MKLQKIVFGIICFLNTITAPLSAICRVPDNLTVGPKGYGTKALGIADDNGHIGIMDFNSETHKLELRDLNQELQASALFEQQDKVFKLHITDSQNEPIGTVVIYDKCLLEFLSADGIQIMTAPSYFTLWPYHGHWRTIFPFITTNACEEVAVFSYYSGANTYGALVVWFTIFNREAFDAHPLDYRVVALFLGSVRSWK